MMGAVQVDTNSQRFVVPESPIALRRRDARRTSQPLEMALPWWRGLRSCWLCDLSVFWLHQRNLVLAAEVRDLLRLIEFHPDQVRPALDHDTVALGGPHLLLDGERWILFRLAVSIVVGLQVCRFRRFVFLTLRRKFFLENGTRAPLQAPWGGVGSGRILLLGHTNLRNLQTCDFPVDGPAAPVGGSFFQVQAALIKLAADSRSKSLAEPALQVAPVNVDQVIGQRAVQVSPLVAPMYLCARLDVPHDLSDEHLALAVGVVPGVQEGRPLQRVVVGLLVEFLGIGEEARDIG